MNALADNIVEEKAHKCPVCGELTFLDICGECKRKVDALMTKKCAYCGKDFYAKNLEKYCGDICKRKARKEKKDGF